LAVVILDEIEKRRSSISVLNQINGAYFFFNACHIKRNAGIPGIL